MPRQTRPRSTSPQPVVEHAVDGTPVSAPRGELPTEVDGSAVQCHLCGCWFRQIGSSHVVNAHGMTAADYRLLAGLRPRHPLRAPYMSVVRAAGMRQQIATDPRLRRAMAAGVALARAGTLQRTARDALRERPVALERQLVESGARLGTARAAAYRERREQRAQALGHADLEDLYRFRYVGERARLDQQAIRLAFSQSKELAPHGCTALAADPDLHRRNAGSFSFGGSRASAASPTSTAPSPTGYR